MANRTMQAKGLKLRKQKRLFPRYLSADYVPTGKPPNMIVMRELKERSKSLAFDDEYLDYLIKRKEMDRQGQHISEGRALAARHIERIRDTMPALMSVNLAPGNTQLKALMFYNESRTRFILFEGHFKTGFCQTSMAYMDRKRCITAWQTNNVRWVHFSSVSPPSNSE